MLIYCKCLNFVIEAKGSELKIFEKKDLKFPEKDGVPEFFKQELYVIDLVSFVKQQPSFASSYSAREWTIHHCLNCSLETHAVYKDCFVVSAKTVTDSDKILKMKQSPSFSPVFRILIKNDPDSDVISSSFLNTQQEKYFGPLQITLSSLQKQVGAALQSETNKTEEKIRIYSDKQYAELEEFRQRVNTEHKILVRLLCKAHEKNADMQQQQHNILSRSVTLPTIGVEQNLPTDKFKLESPRKTQAIGVTRRAPVSRSVSMFVKQENDGLMFNLEGMDETETDNYHSEGESDTDHDDSGSHDEGIDIPRKSGSNSTDMARSLPVNVPVYMSTNGRGRRKTQAIEVDREYNDDQNRVDIAASIKALARSVHGDAVFGDLPRPRFSTQI